MSIYRRLYNITNNYFVIKCGDRLIAPVLESMHHCNMIIKVEEEEAYDMLGWYFVVAKNIHHMNCKSCIIFAIKEDL